MLLFLRVLSLLLFLLPDWLTRTAAVSTEKPFPMPPPMDEDELIVGVGDLTNVPDNLKPDLSISAADKRNCQPLTSTYCFFDFDCLSVKSAEEGIRVLAESYYNSWTSMITKAPASAGGSAAEMVECANMAHLRKIENEHGKYFIQIQLTRGAVASTFRFVDRTIVAFHGAEESEHKRNVHCEPACSFLGQDVARHPFNRRNFSYFSGVLKLDRRSTFKSKTSDKHSDSATELINEAKEALAESQAPMRTRQDSNNQNSNEEGFWRKHMVLLLSIGGVTVTGILVSGLTIGLLAYRKVVISRRPVEVSCRTKRADDFSPRSPNFRRAEAPECTLLETEQTPSADAAKEANLT